MRAIHSKVHLIAIAKTTLSSFLLSIFYVTEANSSEYFEGCVTYKLSYHAGTPKNADDKDKLDLVISDFLNTYGNTKLRCFGKNGDLITTYPDSKVIDKIWYIAKSNTEYTLLQNGDYLFEKLDQRSPTNDQPKVPKIKKTKNKREFQSLVLTETVVNVDGWTDTYWASSKLLRNPLSYQKNMLGYNNLILSSVKGIAIIYEHSFKDWVTRKESATKIDYSSPPDNFFILPTKEPQPW